MFIIMETGSESAKPPRTTAEAKRTYPCQSLILFRASSGPEKRSAEAPFGTEMQYIATDAYRGWPGQKRKLDAAWNFQETNL